MSAANDGAATGSPIRLLTFSTLYPHEGRPNHGVFVENRLRHLVATREATSLVVAPVPWFPSTAPIFGDWRLNALSGRKELRHGLEVYHPRYLQLPAVGMEVAPAAILASSWRQVKHLLSRGVEFDLIDAHYIYPDGVAAVALGRLLQKPVVLTARGSDITQYPDYRLPRKMIQWAMSQASALISVSAGLKRAMVELGAPPEKVTVLRNGVDLDMFVPTEAAVVRQRWGVTGPVLLSVGHLIERKGHHIALRSLVDLPNWTLVIVGQGPQEGELKKLSAQLGLGDRVIFAGSQPHSALPGLYSAADVLILASSREGWANVLLESMACGTPVVASNIPGNPEVVGDSVAGEVVAENTAACFAATIKRVHANRSTQSSPRAYAENFSWDATSRGQLALFDRILTGVARDRDG